ncbi:MAG TPA: hypothetical protein VFR68_05565 [Candidatus Dormibacteraeota bacterium]|nr:hypothetical protein [Candidatus Dormibacteraeota bacterium]
MPLALSPVFALALLLILLGTQVAYVIAPRAPHYLIRLGLSALAVLLGEALGLLGVGGRLALGELHPVTDVAVLTLLHWAGSRWLRRQPV